MMVLFCGFHLSYCSDERIQLLDQNFTHSELQGEIRSNNIKITLGACICAGGIMLISQGSALLIKESHSNEVHMLMLAGNLMAFGGAVVLAQAAEDNCRLILYMHESERGDQLRLLARHRESSYGTYDQIAGDEPV